MSPVTTRLKVLKTGEKQEKGLQKSEDKIPGITSLSDIPLIMIGESLVVLWANDMAKDLFKGDMVGQKCSKIFHNINKTKKEVRA